MRGEKIRAGTVHRAATLGLLMGINFVHRFMVSLLPFATAWMPP